ncbi:hypothetical protein SAMN02910317_00456 [Ruminococcaceae bacterium FB2012]|nr:hypothetical protein SAMN02910317_00456 [Ruminococcaceae bacterium FB2012]
MGAARHIAVCSGALALLLGVPFLCSDSFRRLISSDPDAVTSATTVLDAPSGDYVVLINSERHPNAENLSVWHDFFEGREIGFIFEDIECGTLAGDTGGLEMARSYQSRLPENQMKLIPSDPVLLLSKADSGRFDVIVMSSEAAEKYGAESAAKRPGVQVLRVKGAQDEKA